MKRYAVYLNCATGTCGQSSLSDTHLRGAYRTKRRARRQMRNLSTAYPKSSFFIVNLSDVVGGPR